jgi:hypothetical protein
MIAVFGLAFMGFIVGGLSYDVEGHNKNDEQCVQQEIRKRECHSFVERGTVVEVCADRTDHIKVTCGK